MTTPRTVPNTRINAIDQIETALKLLTSQGYDTHAIWEDHNAWLLTLDTRECTDDDRRWATQNPMPSTIEEHFVDGEPELLTAARCHVGRQYTLSPGQRDVLRERYGLTPTMTVKATNVELFSAEDVIWSVTLKSTEHVDPKRRHVLNEVVLCPAATFFRDADIKDKERELEAATKAAEGKPRAQKSTTSMALGYLT